MDDEVREFGQLCRVLSEDRRICTGNPLNLSHIASWPGLPSSEAEFIALVTAAYKLWREKWRLDIGFLFSRRRDDGTARDFDRLIYQLRTAKQHTDNAEATTRWQTWTGDASGGHAPTTEDDWRSCGRALMITLNAAITCLRRIAADGRRHESFRQAWQEKVAESVESVVTRVAEDLGMQLSSDRQNYHIREVERRWSKYRPGRNEVALDALASFAERSLVSGMDRLPCDYQQILDELRVMGTSDAIAVLHLAHAVAEISRITGEAFIKLVDSTWMALRQGTNAKGT